jgi:hypothetical protein
MYPNPENELGMYYYPNTSKKNAVNGGSSRAVAAGIIGS